MTPEMIGYYLQTNIIDWYVTEDWGEHSDKVKKKVIELLSWIENNTDNKPEDVGDANDCGCCKSWEEVIEGFRELIEKGERIPVEKGE